MLPEVILAMSPPLMTPLYFMHRNNAGELSAEDTSKYLGLYAAFFGGVLLATMFNLKKYVR